MLTTITEKIRRGLWRRDPCLPDPAIVRLGNRLAAMGDCGVSWCGCGGILTPVLFRHGDQTEVVAVACLGCHQVVPVCVGVLDAAPRKAAPAETLQ